MADTSKIKTAVREFFEKMGFETEIKALELEDGLIAIKVKTQEPQVLIGQNGQTLLEIQHLLKIILRRKIQKEFYMDLDINDYKSKKTAYLKETANSAANEVAITKKEKVLLPMPAYERRIIHMELAQRTDVKAESVGEEPERRIVIRPI